MIIVGVIVILALAIAGGIAVAHLNATPTPEEQLRAQRAALYAAEDPYSPEHPDLGQHDHWKRVFRDIYLKGQANNLDSTLAAVIRRQDYMRFASASVPSASRADLLAFLYNHEGAIKTEAQSRFDANVQEASRRPGLTYPSVQETIEIHSWIALNPSTRFAPLNPLT